MSGFTPGPWRLSRTQRYVMDGVAAPWVCEVTERPGWEANARLIASAPALLEALKELVKLGESGTGYVSAAWIEAHEDARQALAQALGGE